MRTQATAASGSVPVRDGQVVRTTLGTWVKAICRALEAAGCDSAALLAEAGFDLKSLDGPNARCPLTQTERTLIQNDIDTIYRDFKSRVSEGRKKRMDYIDSIAQGRVWTGRQAKEKGSEKESGD